MECNVETVNGYWKLFPGKLFAVCREERGMYMAVYRSQCP
jgi:hypothetical protein